MSQFPGDVDDDCDDEDKRSIIEEAEMPESSMADAVADVVVLGKDMIELVGFDSCCRLTDVPSFPGWLWLTIYTADSCWGYTYVAYYLQLLLRRFKLYCFLAHICPCFTQWTGKYPAAQHPAHLISKRRRYKARLMNWSPLSQELKVCVSELAGGRPERERERGTQSIGKRL